MKNIVALTGAGISAESGLQTFRGQNGLWEGHAIEDVATPEAFYRDPEMVYRFYNLRRAQLQDPAVQPNPAHLALALLAKKWNSHFSLITQNVDNLHEQAGQADAIHMHGELEKIRCLSTGEVFSWKEDLEASTPHPKGLSNALRPHIVWFGEMPLYMGEIQHKLENADLFLSIGTSGKVYPAAQFATWVPPTCETIEFNLDETDVSHLFQKSIVGPASQSVPEFVTQWLKDNPPSPTNSTFKDGSK